MKELKPREPAVQMIGADEIDRMKGLGMWGEGWRRLRKNRMAMAALGVVGLYAAIALLGWAGLVGADEELYEREVPPGSYRVFSIHDIRDIQALAGEILEASGADPKRARGRVVEFFPEEALAALPGVVAASEVETHQKEALVASLNELLKSREFFTAYSDRTIHESPNVYYPPDLDKTDAIIGESLSDQVILMFNHRTIRDAFPDLIGRLRRHWFGTNWQGRDVLTLTLGGAKAAMFVATVATILSICIGTFLGAVAGYFRGGVDDLIIWFYTTFQSIPGILLIIAFAVVLKEKTLFGYELSGLPAVCIALGITRWVGICRLIRGEVLKHREQEYVDAARAFGVGNFRIIFRHIIPNVFHLIIITFSLGFLSAIHAEVILTFLGLGAQDMPTWGTMISNAVLVLPKGVWWGMTAATGAIFIISLALNILGDALRDALDPKLRT